jgi:hypothetical protein
LIANAGVNLSTPRKRPAGAKVLADDDLSEMFGIDMAAPDTSTRAPARLVSTRPPTGATAAKSKQTTPTQPANVNGPAPTGGRRRLTPKKRQAIAERMRQYWAERRAQARTRKGS